MSQSEIEAIQFNSSKTLYTFYAIYAVTKYKFIFKNPDDSIVYEEEVPAGMKIVNPLTHRILSYSDSTLGLEECYKALGFVEAKSNSIVLSENDFKKVEKKVDTVISQSRDREFYVCYMKIDVHDNVADHSLFNFSTYSSEGVLLQGNSEIEYSGKLTLPATAPDGRKVIAVSGFDNQLKLTHVFHERGTSLKSLIGTGTSDAAFRECTSLEYFEMPESLREIQQYSFRNAKLKILNFNKGLIAIGKNAFAGMTGGLSLIHIPGSVTTIDGNAFAWHKPFYSYVQFGGEGDPTQITSLTNTAFAGNYNTDVISEITYYSNSVPDANVVDLLSKLDRKADFNISGKQA